MGPTTCFKYRSGASAVRALAEGTLYFASPRELNDSLEAKFDLATPHAFHQVLADTIRAIAAGKGVELEGPKRVPVASELASVITEENERFQKACDGVGIFSTSRRPDSQPMWAYYCDSGRGFCFELVLTKELIEKYGIFPAEVTYSTSSRIHNRAEDLRDLLLLYAKENPDWSMERLQDFALSEDFRRRWGIMTTARAVSVKHADWKHEEETRFVSARPQALPLLGEVLKRVIFMRTDFIEWSSIMMLLTRLYPDVEVAQIGFHHTAPFVRLQEMERKLIPIEQLAR
jgi:hypothetical protein